MDSSDALRLTQSLDNLTSAIKDGAQQITDQLQEIDESLATLIGRKLDAEELPSPAEMVQRITDIGARAVLKVVTDWEKRIQGS